MDNETAARVLTDCRWEIEREMPAGMWTKEQTVEALNIAIEILRTDAPVGFNIKDFETFYNAYPKHEAVGDARKAFKALKVDKKTLEKMLSAIAMQISSGIIKKGDRYTPLPATWLRAGRWEDEVDSHTENKEQGGSIPWILPD